MQYKLIEFVKDKHKDQVRKYTGEPYYNHLYAVASMAENVSSVAYGFEIGLCHDLLEDTDCTPLQLKVKLRDIGYSPIAANHIVDAVIDLTDVYTHEECPLLNRSARKEREVARLAKVSPDAQSVKYCDLIDNTKSIVEHDKNFAKVYLKEKQDMLTVMTKGDKALYSKCYDTLMEATQLLFT